jgi:hypothetical protein
VTSDIDVLAAIELRVKSAAFAELVALHTRLAALPNPYAERLESV